MLTTAGMDVSSREVGHFEGGIHQTKTFDTAWNALTRSALATRAPKLPTQLRS